MYNCLKCGNKSEFEEVNVVKTYVKQNEKGEIVKSSDEFFYRENVICLNCESTLEDEDVVEIVQSVLFH